MNPRYIQYSWQKYYNQSGFVDPSDIGDDDWMWNKHHSKEERRESITEKVLRLRERIENWCNKNGYDKMDNDVERKDEEGTIYYRRTDWDMVDDLYGLLINDEQWWPHPNQFLKMNELWKRYR